MASVPDIDSKLHALIPLLSLNQKQAILEHMEALAAAPRERSSGVPGSELVKLSGIIPREVADEWKRIIEEPTDSQPELKRATLKDLESIVGSIPEDDLDLMRRAIEEDCERIDTDGW